MMKSLKFLVVMLAVICLCPISANADILLDSFNYPTDAALQAVWPCLSGNPATVATINGVPCMDMYYDCTGLNGNARMLYKQSGQWNASAWSSMNFSLMADNPSQLWYGEIMLETAAGIWHSAKFYPFYDQWHSYTISASSLGLNGQPELADVRGIYVNLWMSSTNWISNGQVNAYISDLTAQAPAPVPEPGSLLTLGVGVLGMAGLVSRRRW